MKWDFFSDFQTPTCLYKTSFWRNFSQKIPIIWFLLTESISRPRQWCITMQFNMRPQRPRNWGWGSRISEIGIQIGRIMKLFGFWIFCKKKKCWRIWWLNGINRYYEHNNFRAKNGHIYFWRENSIFFSVFDTLHLILSCLKLWIFAPKILSF